MNCLSQMSGKICAITLLLVLISSCTTVTYPLPCPARPTLAAITPEEQRAIDPDVVRRMAENQLELKTYAKRLEARAGCTW